MTNFSALLTMNVMNNNLNVETLQSDLKFRVTNKETGSNKYSTEVK